MSYVSLVIDAPLRTPDGDAWATGMAAEWVKDPEMRHVFRWLTTAGATPSPPIDRADGRGLIYASLRTIFNPPIFNPPTAQNLAPVVSLVPNAARDITQAILQAA